MKLGVNIDHIATLRQVRGTPYPSVLQAALIAEEAGADGITLHLREDRRHIQDSDVVEIAKAIHIHLNFEMAVTREMISFAENLRPAKVCLVPEKREELTTEGGLDVITHFKTVEDACKRLSAAGCEVSLFIDPDAAQIEAASQAGAPVIEIHTGCYAELLPGEAQQAELVRIEKAAHAANKWGLIVNAGHGLHYDNTAAIARISLINELNIGHAIVAESLWIGFRQAVIKMKKILQSAKNKDAKFPSRGGVPEGRGG